MATGKRSFPATEHEAPKHVGDSASSLLLISDQYYSPPTLTDELKGYILAEF